MPGLFTMGVTPWVYAREFVTWSDTKGKIDAVTDEDEPPWGECRVCEYNWTLKPDRDGVLRFEDHNRDKKVRTGKDKGKLISVQCEGSYRTPDEAREIRRSQPWSDPSQRPL